MENSYLNIVLENKYKLLSLYNLDPNSPTYGYGDRQYWGWKVSDYPNGTMQGGIHTLAILIKLELISSSEEKERTLELIKSSILATKSIMASNGSMAEAYPNENSFCVTALVAFDLLSALDLLKEQIEASVFQKSLEIISPLIDFITKNGEEHAIISNHLATGVAAICKWNKLTNKNNSRFKELLEIIYNNQSSEGWYKEYEGADPGYQTLCTYYLCSAYLDSEDAVLKKSLIDSAGYLKYFSHVNGTIGGLYGSRNTSVYYPGGLVAMSRFVPEFAALTNELEKGLKGSRHMLPQSIDIGNYIPLLNAYAFAALHYGDNKLAITKTPKLFLEEEINFLEAGVFIKNTSKYQAILNYKKGGCLKVYSRETGQLDWEEGSYFGTVGNNKLISSQIYNETENFAKQELNSRFYFVDNSSPSPFTTIILRVLAITIFKSVYLGNLFKKLIVKKLMTGKKLFGGKLHRKYIFNEDNITIKDKMELPPKISDLAVGINSKAIHMASSGYNLRDTLEQPKHSRIVKYEKL